MKSSLKVTWESSHSVDRKCKLFCLKLQHRKICNAGSGKFLCSFKMRMSYSTLCQMCGLFQNDFAVLRKSVVYRHAFAQWHKLSRRREIFLSLINICTTNNVTFGSQERSSKLEEKEGDLHFLEHFSEKFPRREGNCLNILRETTPGARATI